MQNLGSNKVHYGKCGSGVLSKKNFARASLLTSSTCHFSSTASVRAINHEYLNTDLVVRANQEHNVIKTMVDVLFSMIV